MTQFMQFNSAELHFSIPCDSFFFRWRLNLLHRLCGMWLVCHSFCFFIFCTFWILCLDLYISYILASIFHLFGVFLKRNTFEFLFKIEFCFFPYFSFFRIFSSSSNFLHLLHTSFFHFIFGFKILFEFVYSFPVNFMKFQLFRIFSSFFSLLTIRTISHSFFIFLPMKKKTPLSLI